MSCTKSYYLFQPETIHHKEKSAIVLCILLIVPALLINLGLLAVIEDEAIRALVALEMWYSGDYIAPTLNAIPYYNKPPLYNWIILVSYTVFGNADEFSLRFPAALSTFLYGLCIYLIYKKEMSKLAAISVTLLAITCGRIFFYDSFHGLIDMTFSMCMFSLMLGSYQLARQKAWTKMFAFAYGLASVGFLLKTLPALVFLGLSLLLILIVEREFKRFFSLPHFIGIGLFILIVGGYYFAYSINHDIVALFKKMLTESTDRTVVKFGIGKTIAHFITFPSEVFVHFLPWTVLCIYLFKISYLKKLWNHEFLRMNILLLIVNILLYWVSPQVYARYLLMFPPLIFAPLYYLHRLHQEENTIHYRVVKGLMILLTVLIGLGMFAVFFIQELAFIPHIYIKASTVCLLIMVAAYLFITAPKFRLVYIFLFVVIFRIGFDWFVLPHRNANDYSDILRKSAIETSQKYKGQSIYAQESGLFRGVSYYLTRETKRIIPATKNPVNGLLITFEKEKESCKKIGNLKSRVPSNDYLVLECKE